MKKNQRGAAYLHLASRQMEFHYANDHNLCLAGVWPLYGVCNEISIDKRFCPENLLLFGKFVLS